MAICTVNIIPDNLARRIDGSGTCAITRAIDGRVWIIAVEDIPAGAELCYDYNLYDGDDDPCICTCGAKNCRGSMYSDEELKRLAKLEKAKKKEEALAAR